MCGVSTDDPAEPTDRDIEDQLRARSPEAWTDLWGAMGRVDGLLDVGGELTIEHPRRDNGDGTFTFGFAEPSPELMGLLSAIDEAGLVVPFDWMTWLEVNGLPEAGALHRRPVSDAVRTLTAVVRGDRFAEGAFADAVRDGTVGLALERIRQFVEPGDRPPADL
jgi:hypothetical protein